MTDKPKNIAETATRRSTRTRATPRKSLAEDDTLANALAGYAEAEKLKSEIHKLNIKDTDRRFKKTCDNQKRAQQVLARKVIDKRKPGTTRSGKKRGFVKRAEYTNGRWVNKGIDDATEPFDQSELDYLRNAIKKFNHVEELKFEHLKYLVVYVFLDELKDIKMGKAESKYHTRYMELLKKGKSTADLFTDIYTSLFTNEQRDYINGLLQGIFDTVTPDSKGDIKHKEISYVCTVMLAEIAIRVVKYVIKLDSAEEALTYMKNKAREALGFDPED